jgi:hypothetical protein
VPAIVTSVDIDTSRQAEATAMLNDMVMPMAKAATGLRRWLMGAFCRPRPRHVGRAVRVRGGRCPHWPRARQDRSWSAQSLP